MTTYPQGTNAVLTVQWSQNGGASADVTGQTITITRIEDAVVVLAATSAGISHLATGLYAYTWPVPAGATVAQYVAVWNATYSGIPVSVAETFDVSSPNATPVIGGDVWYCTIEDVQRALDIKGTARSARQIARIIPGISRNIEGQMGGRKFYPLQATRYKDWPDLPTSGAYPWRVWLDDAEVIQVDQLVSGGVTLTPDQYLLEPVNAGPPYTRIDVNLGANGSFSSGRTWQQSLAITGLFGGCPANTEPGGELASGVATSSTPTVAITDSSVVGTGSIIQVDNERMLVTKRSMTTTGQTLQANMGASAAADILEVTDGTAYAEDEVLLLDSERMLIVDIAGNNLIVKRAWDGSTLATHTAPATVYAARLLTVTRGALGTTASTHSQGASVLVHIVPVRTLAVAEAVNQLLQEESGIARTVGSGDNTRNASGAGLKDIRAQALSEFGKKTRVFAI